MHVDANSLPPQAALAADLCIVGAGPAGLTIARELARSKLNIVVLESGGFEFDADVQALYEGESVGLKYDLTGTRLRYFGGSSNHWGATAIHWTSTTSSNASGCRTAAGPSAWTT